MSINFFLSSMTPDYILKDLVQVNSISIRGFGWSETHPGGIVQRKHHFCLGQVYSGNVHSLSAIDEYFRSGDGFKEMMFFKEIRLNAWVWKMNT